MGLGQHAVELLTNLRGQGYIPNGSSVVEMGAQQLADSFFVAPHALADIATAFEVTPRIFGEVKSVPPQRTRWWTRRKIVRSETVETMQPDAPASREFWKWLGLSYAAIDIDESPDSIPLDLNFDHTPAEMVGQFTVVTNFGTTEHVANQMNAFKIIHDLCAPGGIMIHTLPAQGMMTHGLFNYNPKFFWMLARSNAYRWVLADMFLSKSIDPLSPDVIGEMEKYPTGFAERAKKYRTGDGSLHVVLQKWVDLPYVPPIDVPTGAGVSNQEIRERYWTVFDDDRLQRTIKERLS